MTQRGSRSGAEQGKIQSGGGSGWTGAGPRAVGGEGAGPYAGLHPRSLPRYS